MKTEFSNEISTLRDLAISSLLIIKILDFFLIFTERYGEIFMKLLIK
tara:strand:- start:294 stop:434 length:141 start_codon:yes stop_codon:yes gene_type:complete